MTSTMIARRWIVVRNCYGEIYPACPGCGCPMEIDCDAAVITTQWHDECWEWLAAIDRDGAAT